MENLKDYFEGKSLRGDDFSIDDLKKWYTEEKEAYANLGSNDKAKYSYGYHALNKYNGYRHITSRNISNCLSIGGAYGEELRPLLNRLQEITILEPSNQLRKEKLGSIEINYLEPEISGKINCNDGVFNLVTCFGVLHHIPNVSFVMSEIHRVLKSGGVFLLREPIVSMGDWTVPRIGLTKNERGIPFNLLNRIIEEQGFRICRKTLCFTKPFDVLWIKVTRANPYNSEFYIKVDNFLALLFKWNYKYHSRTFFKKIRPTCCFYVLEKC